jgi:hypothetical protein
MMIVESFFPLVQQPPPLDPFCQRNLVASIPYPPYSLARRDRSSTSGRDHQQRHVRVLIATMMSEPILETAE